MAATDDALGPDRVARAAQGSWLFDRLPQWVVDTLTADQKEAIHRAIEDPAWKRPPVNIRFTVPVIHKRFYVTVVSGPEQRSAERRGRDRHKYPLRTLANVFFFLGVAAIFYVVALLALAFMSAIIEI
jgi:hypothetical protein